VVWTEAVHTVMTTGATDTQRICRQSILIRRLISQQTVVPHTYVCWYTTLCKCRLRQQNENQII